MSDPFAQYAVTPTAPATDAFAVTPSDTDDLAITPRYIYVGSAGDIVADMMGGANVTFAAVPAGTVLPVRVRRVYATGTTATSIVGLV